MNRILPLVTAFCISIFLVVINDQPESTPQKRKHFNGPAEFLKFHHDIRTKFGESKPGYKPGYKLAELTKAKNTAHAFRKNSRIAANGVIAWSERGPANVPGRTRGLIVDPDDATKNTWFAGSVGGGVWKTTNAGQSWTWLTPDLPNLATTVLAMAESDHNIIYLGTGEGFGNVDAIDGAGIFKSTDRGVTWNQLSSTVDFPDINRIIIDPSNADIVLTATNDGIYRSTNGGSSWIQVLDNALIQDLKASPNNFSIQYATQNSLGVLKSTDGGETWSLSNNGMRPNGRVEIAISPVDPLRIFASAQSELGGSQSDLYVSNNGGANWSLVEVLINNSLVELLGSDPNDPNDDQGWYDNTILCDPFDKDVVYVGGIELFRIDVGSSASQDNYTILEEVPFISLINFGAAFYQGRLNVGTIPEKFSVEIRFGQNQTQKAHRFTVPEGATSGVDDANYTFQNYVDVPFEVWDVTNNQQLMVSFRDQDRNGEFNLYEANTTSTTAIEQSREYLFIHGVNYSDTQSSSIATSGGQTFERKYFIWPVLAEGQTWDESNLPESILTIQYSSIDRFASTTNFITNDRGRFGTSSKNTNLHVDHHNLIAIPTSGNTYRILNANDGGVALSNSSSTPGINNGDWSGPVEGYNTSQFYGADKRPGLDQYIGGMQDNGTWFSPNNQSASKTTNYTFAIGGDGFEAIWNNLNDQLLIGGAQGNFFLRSTNGGASWVNARNGLTGDFPFISKLANSKELPNRIFTVGDAGVFVSQNFGQNWTLTPINEKWIGSASFSDVEVSRANANIVWAGDGMTSNISLHVSTDGGKTFSTTNNYASLGGITKLASHPFEAQTAYAIFSQANSPKILRTTDLGQTWQDISGFSAGSSSNNGFPDVAVYCLYVRPDNPNILWAGTEIGIVESQDNGTTWVIVEDFPNVSVWDMKGQDDQVVIATHGRGIWTATINAPQSNFVKTPIIGRFATTPQKFLLLEFSSETVFDSVEVFVGSSKAGTITSFPSGTTRVELSGVTPGGKSIKTISYKNGAPFESSTKSVTQLNLLSTEENYVEFFKAQADVLTDGFTQTVFAGEPSSSRRVLQSPHNYAVNKEHTALLTHPFIVAENSATIVYPDIAIVEPGNDYVVMEGTKNGLDWIELTARYDASFNTTWQNTYNANGAGTREMFVEHTINLHDFFSAGDTILVRYRLSSNATTTAWGAAVDYIAIQDVVLSPEATAVDDDFKIYPNPARGEFFIQYRATANDQPLLQIINTQGRVIEKRMLTTTSANGLNIEKIAVPTGNYLIILNDRLRKRSGKVTVIN
jgi:photosystem II stability/assembly factor-like uncharacterized protein